MDPIRKAILDGDSARIWALAAGGPIDSETINGYLVLALRKGIVASVVPLVAFGGKSDSWTPSECLLVDYLAEISAQWCASWLTDIEYEAYSLAIGEQASDDWPYSLTERQIDDLQMLASEFSGWAAWLGTGAQFVQIDNWRPMYQRWKLDT